MTGKRIILTGGGSAGHVMPNVALFDALLEEGFELHYVGTPDGMERGIIEKYPYVQYHAIESGKLRRGFSVSNIIKNITDPIKILKGSSQAKKLISEIRPDIIFSKGGFVSVPIVLAAKGRVPIVAHECDFTPGLANKICAKHVDRICVSFEDTLAYCGDKGVYTGTPIRAELLHGGRAKGKRFLKFEDDKPILLVMGGSLGAQAINDALRAAIPTLTQHFNIVHLCGKGKADASYDGISGYRQIEFLSKELGDVFSCTDVMVSRAGANSVFEILALKIPSLLIPLPASGSRGDQLQNAEYFKKRGYALVELQENINSGRLCELVFAAYAKKDELIGAMRKDPASDSVARVMDVIKECMAK